MLSIFNQDYRVDLPPRIFESPGTLENDSQSYQVSVGIGASSGGTLSGALTGFEVMTADLKMSAPNEDATGDRATRSRFANRVRQGEITVGGPLVFTPAYSEYKKLLPYAGLTTGATMSLTETLPPLYVVIDKVVEVFAYPVNYVNKLTMEGAKGRPVTLTLDLVGTTEVPTGGAMPTVTFSNLAPFMLYDSIMTMLGAAYNIGSFKLEIDNHLDVEYFNNQTPTSITPADRTIKLTVPTPWTSNEESLYNQAVAGASASCALTYGGNTMTLSIGVLQVPPLGQSIPNRSRIPLELNGECRASTNPLSELSVLFSS